jgi:hypothetical protein
MGTKNWTPEPAPHRFGALPRERGVVFVCGQCGRRQAVARDLALETWGKRGVVDDVARKLRCRNCNRRGMRAYVSPPWANLGSPSPLDRLVETLMSLIAGGRVD